MRASKACRIYHHPRESLSASLLYFVLCISVFFPGVLVGNVAVRLDDFCAVLILPFLATILLSGKAFFRGRCLLLFALWLGIIVHGLLFGFFGSWLYLSIPSLSTEMWQYVRRMAFFFIAYYFAWCGLISSERVAKILVVSLLCVALVGIIQILPGWPADLLSDIYARTESQHELLSERAFATKRVYGVAGFSNSWGGFSIYTSAVALSGLLLPIGIRSKYNSLYKLSFVALFLISIVNIFFCGSRGALLGFFAVLLFAPFVAIRLSSKDNLLLIKYSFLMMVTFLILSFAFYDRVNTLWYRFIVLFEEHGGERVDQIEVALLLLSDWYAILFGVGNLTQRTLATSFGTEVEPVYILVNYGLIGFFLRYGLLLYILSIAYLSIKRSLQAYVVLAAATFLSIIGYCVFSCSYFFFQELYVGTIPWLLFGWVAGFYARVRDVGSMETVGKFLSPDICADREKRLQGGDSRWLR